jgi:molybdopterin-guanine dinucleotide biosynthesis protein A
LISDDIVVAGPDRGPWPAVGASAVRAAPDREPFGGPLQALAGALAVARHDIAIVVAGDMPALVPAVLEALVVELAGDARRAAAILGDPADPVRRQPLPVALRVAQGGAAADAAVAAGDRSLMGLLDRLSVAVLPSDRWQAIDPEARSLLDVDVPEDLAGLPNLAGKRRIR